MATNLPIIEKVPPQALDAEMAVLGAMLIEKEAITKAIDIIKEDDFYKEVHRQIFTVARDLYLENQPADIITIADKLKKVSMFSEVGGVSYLTSLIDSVQTAANVEHYASIIRDKSILRNLINAGSQIVTDAFNEKYSPEEILDQSQSRLFNISQVKNNNGFVKVGELVRPTLKILEKLHSDKKDIPGLRTGFSELDVMTAGLQPSELIIIAARPSMGKTSFALNIAEHVALEEKKPVAIFSLEMSKESLMMRFLASVSRVNAHNLRKGRFQPADWSRLTTNAQNISESPIYIDDSSDISVIELRARARRLATELEAKKTPLSLVVIDYIQIMRGSSRNSESRQLEVAEISRSLKGLARDLKVPVIALSQLSRKTEDKGRKDNKPQLSDLRDSGAIEQDADVVAFIHREGYYNRQDPDLKNSASVIIGKQRNGPTGEISLTFESEYTKFSDLSQRREQE
ncbi:replicative DNA helicase [Endomicrobium proavitum]|uniref:Replicative DNA helicase n=1 Tax=Endomicrobium proavitum TaxID=1408281 RepID=A0A0G3WHL4_9BACT|nr:replicative DNA helicase [Endomicrobium proavitum]AKL97395.1 replicative DNA helicase [Endomicrobium proavitum]